MLSSVRKFDFGRELLKIIAIVTMFIDHVGRILYPEVLILVVIGRLSLPLFAYLLVLGIETTKNPRKYMLTILLFALISQGPYFMAFEIQPLERLNILFSLFLSAVTVYLYNKKSPVAIIPFLLSIIIMTEGSYYVVLTVVGMKLLKETPKFGTLALLALNIQFLFVPDFETRIQVLSLFALPLILLHIRNLLRKEIVISADSISYFLRKYSFYFFYPLHLYFLFIIKSFF